MYLIGYDIGSSSIKAALVEAETGATLAVAQSPATEMGMSAHQPGWGEQDPADGEAGGLPYFVRLRPPNVSGSGEPGETGEIQLVRPRYEAEHRCPASHEDQRLHDLTYLHADGARGVARGARAFWKLADLDVQSESAGRVCDPLRGWGWGHDA